MFGPATGAICTIGHSTRTFAEFLRSSRDTGSSCSSTSATSRRPPGRRGPRPRSSGESYWRTASDTNTSWTWEATASHGRTAGTRAGRARASAAMRTTWLRPNSPPRWTGCSSRQRSDEPPSCAPKRCRGNATGRSSPMRSSHGALGSRTSSARTRRNRIGSRSSRRSAKAESRIHRPWERCLRRRAVERSEE